jgi:hypothetical protein
MGPVEADHSGATDPGIHEHPHGEHLEWPGGLPIGVIEQILLPSATGQVHSDGTSGFFGPIVAQSILPGTLIHAYCSRKGPGSAGHMGHVGHYHFIHFGTSSTLARHPPWHFIQPGRWIDSPLFDE